MIARTFLGIVLIPTFGYVAACFSGTIAWFLADLFLIPAYFLCVRALRKRYIASQEKLETSV